MSVKKTVKKSVARKTAAKKVAKKTTKKVAKKTTKKNVAQVNAPRAKKGGLRKPQLRILETLAKVKVPVDRKRISEKAGVDNASCTEYLGSVDKDVRLNNDATKFPSLVSLKLIKSEFQDPIAKTGVLYTITALGRKSI